MRHVWGVTSWPPSADDQTAAADANCPEIAEVGTTIYPLVAGLNQLADPTPPVSPAQVTPSQLLTALVNAGAVTQAQANAAASALGISP